jgi:hypothetical protein
MTFQEVCNICISNEDLIREWNRLTGHKLGVSRLPLIIGVDKVCGYDPNEKAMPDFINFVFKYIWLPLVNA